MPILPTRRQRRQEQASVVALVDAGGSGSRTVRDGDMPDLATSSRRAMGIKTGLTCVAFSSVGSRSHQEALGGLPQSPRICGWSATQAEPLAPCAQRVPGTRRPRAVTGRRADGRPKTAPEDRRVRSCGSARPRPRSSAPPVPDGAARRRRRRVVVAMLSPGVPELPK